MLDWHRCPAARSGGVCSAAYGAIVDHDGCRGLEWYGDWIQFERLPIVKNKPAMVTFRVSEPPHPECPRCHHQHVEELYPVIPRWLACHRGITGRSEEHTSEL